MDRKWFKAKKYGWGWTPYTWEGWFVTVVYIMLVVNAFVSLDNRFSRGFDTLTNFFPTFLILTGMYLLVVWLTGETPRWSWGEKTVATRKSSPAKKKAKSRRRK